MPAAGKSPAQDSLLENGDDVPIPMSISHWISMGFPNGPASISRLSVRSASSVLGLAATSAAGFV